MSKAKVRVVVEDPVLRARVEAALAPIEAELTVLDAAMQDELVGAFMHDAKNSLTSVTANLSFAADATAAVGADVRDALADAGESAARLVRQIDDLVVLTRAQMGLALARRETRVAHVLRGVLERGQRWAATFDVAPSLAVEGDLSVQTDPELLGRAVSELFELTVRYCGAKARFEVGARETAGGARVFLRHDGRPLEANPRLSAWLAGKRRPAEIGFGLAVAQAVAEGHGGALEVGAAPPWSAVVALTIPPAAAPPR